jgi:hypothetical protein
MNPFRKFLTAAALALMASMSFMTSNAASAPIVIQPGGAAAYMYFPAPAKGSPSPGGTKGTSSGGGIALTKLAYSTTYTVTPAIGAPCDTVCTFSIFQTGAGSILLTSTIPLNWYSDVAATTLYTGCGNTNMCTVTATGTNPPTVVYTKEGSPSLAGIIRLQKMTDATTYTNYTITNTTNSRACDVGCNATPGNVTLTASRPTMWTNLANTPITGCNPSTSCTVAVPASGGVDVRTRAVCYDGDIATLGASTCTISSYLAMNKVYATPGNGGGDFGWYVGFSSGKHIIAAPLASTINVPYYGYNPSGFATLATPVCNSKIPVLNWIVPNEILLDVIFNSGLIPYINYVTDASLPTSAYSLLYLASSGRGKSPINFTSLGYGGGMQFGMYYNYGYYTEQIKFQCVISR